MSAAAPWSVKGIDPKAREIAKDLARREGMTLGEWLNARIMIEGDSDGTPLPNDRRAGSRRAEDLPAPEAAKRLNAIISELGERLEAAERRSASAIQNVDQAVSGIVRRMESDREESTRQNRRMDDIARELRDGHLRLQRLESTVQDPARQDAAVSDLRDRLDRAQEATGLALKGLERSFAALDSRIGGDTGNVSEERLTQLASSLSQQIEANRLDLMRQIEASTDNTRLARVEQAISQLSAQTRAAEMRSARAVEAMGHEIMRIAQNMNGRMQSLETRGGDVSEEAINSRLDQRLADLGRTLDEKLDREISRQSASLDARLTRQEDDHALALERLGGEITRISDRLSERIAQTERRSSQAIDDIGRRLNESSEKFERRHDDVSGELAERLRQSEERTRRLIEEAKEVRAQREAASLNAAPRLTAALPPTDDLSFEPMPVATEAAPDSLFASPLDWKPQDAKPGDWRGAAFGSAKSEPLPEAQASPGWADAIAAEMAVEPFPTTDTLRPFGSLDAALDESLEEDSRLLAQAAAETEAKTADEAGQADTASEQSDDFPSIFASSEHEAQDHSFDVTPPHEAADPLSMTFDAVVDEVPTEDVDPLGAPLKSTRDVIDSARAAIADEEPAPVIRSTFGLKRKKGGKSVLQEKLDRKASRDGSTLGNALKASALAMLVVGGGGYATLKVVKDQNLNLNFGTETDPAMAPIAALALDATPAEAVPSAEIASTEGAAIFTRALSLLDSGDPAGVEALRRAAEMGYVPAQMRLAALFTEGGVGVEADPVQARDWTRRAAESGEPRAMQHYATQLYDGVGGAADEAGALEWMRKAAEAGRVDAQYNLAHLYENGIKGMRADKVEAFTWYMIAARRGDQQALEAVQRLTPSLSAAQRDRARAGADAFNVAPVNG